ncbi:MAG: hypothetical protein MUP21_06035 [Dehalococcoidia bacterium]|nr:hypothetical protein [Dehalococcoidia bacterium]
MPQVHKEAVNLEEVAIHVTLADGSAQWFRVPTARLGGEIALIHPQTRKPCRCLYARTEKGVFYYAEATGRGRPQASPAYTQQAAHQPAAQPAPQPVPPTQVQQPAAPAQEDKREEKKHGTNLLTAFSLHVGYLLSICEQNNPFIHEVLAAKSPDLRDRLEKVLTDVTIAILKERDG